MRLLFVGTQDRKAEEAIRFYVSLFPDAQIRNIKRYGPAESEPAGAVKLTTFVLDGREFMALESGLNHEFTFTPALSIVVQCDSEAENDRLYRRFMEGRHAHMPLGSYGSSSKFAWIEDRYSLSW